MFRLLFSYYSHAPPKFEDLKKIVEAVLKPMLGEISVSEEPHYSLSPVTWVCPVLVSTSAKTSAEAISDALPRISGTQLISVTDESEPSVGGSAGGSGIPAGLPAVGVPVTQPPGSDRGE